MTAVAARAAAQIAEAAASRWVQSMGLERAFAPGGGGWRASGMGGGAVRIGWPSLERSGRAEAAFVELDAETGAVTAPRAFSHWSDVPGPRSRVIVVPDIVTFIAMSQARMGESISPYLFTVPLPGHILPPDWSERRYWEFASVTVLTDRLSHPSPALPLLASMQLSEAGVATPPDGGTWRAWAAGQRRFGYDGLASIEAGALPLDAFRRDVAGLDVDWLRHCCRSLDDEGRLCRVVEVDWGSGPGHRGRPFLIRSDRTFVELGPEAVSSISGAGPGVAWTSTSAAAFVDRSEPTDGRRIGAGLETLLAGYVDPGGLRSVCAYVALTYLFQAFAELPVCLVGGGTPATMMSLRRMLKALCYEPLVAGRARAAQLARVADAGRGVMLLDEPGPLCGPQGVTEVGRFVIASTLDDGSSYHALTGRAGLRTLDVFGARIVLASRASASGLDCAAVVAVAGVGDRPEPADPSALSRLRDDLHRWSMSVFEDIRERASGCAAGQVVAFLVREMFGDEATAAPGGAVRHAEAPVVAAPAAPSPAEIMDDVLATVSADSRDVSMIRVMLELAVRGATGEAFTPERVGRWLSAHPAIDPDRAVDRRRLHGQISRIYPLACSGDRVDLDGDPFGFCRDRTCDACSYDDVCPAVFPDLKRRKQGL